MTAKILPLWQLHPPEDKVCANCVYYKPNSDMINLRGKCFLSEVTMHHSDSCEGFEYWTSTTTDKYLHDYIREAEAYVDYCNAKVEQLLDDNDW